MHLLPILTQREFCHLAETLLDVCYRNGFRARKRAALYGQNSYALLVLAGSTGRFQETKGEDITTAFALSPRRWMYLRTVEQEFVVGVLL